MVNLESSIRERTVATNGVDLHVLEAGEPGAPLVVLAHGFPELAFSWRHQLTALADGGYHVVAPDQRGYGRSSRPGPVESYGILDLTADLLGLLDDCGADRATFVGHDWGSMVVWNQALLNPDRVTAVVGMSVPYLPRGSMPPLQAMRQVMGDSFFYILYFQKPGEADADLAADPATTMRRMLCGLQAGDAAAAAAMAAPGDAGFVARLPEPEGLPDWLDQSELDHYTDEFRRTGFTGGINWYRNLDRNWADTARVQGAKVGVPSLFIGGALDPVLVMSPPGIGDSFLSDHRGNLIIEGAGHWVQQEKPDQVNAALLDFLADVQA